MTIRKIWLLAAGGGISTQPPSLMKSLISIFAVAVIFMASAAPANAVIPTHEEYVDLINRINAIEIDSEKPSEALYDLHRIDIMMQRKYSVLDINKKFGVDEKALMNSINDKANKIVTAIQEHFGELGAEVDETDNEQMTSLMVEFTKFLTVDLNVTRDYSIFMAPVMGRYMGFFTDNEPTITGHFKAAGGDPDMMFKIVVKQTIEDREIKCKSDVANLGVSTKDINDIIAHGSATLRVWNTFCPLSKLMEVTDDIKGTFYKNGDGYTLKLDEAGKGFVVIDLTKNDAGRWKSNQVDYYDINGNLTKSEKTNLSRWTVIISGLRGYWVKNM